MKQNSEIGPAKPDDFPAIRALCNGFIDWCRSRYGENAWFVDRYYTPEAWSALLDSLPRIHSAPDGEILVARLNGKVVGCVMMQRIDEHTCEIKRMFISPEGRGLGLGRRLAENIVRVAAERGYTTMRLDTGRNHDEALSLYRSIGFIARTTKPLLNWATISSLWKPLWRGNSVILSISPRLGAGGARS